MADLCPHIRRYRRSAAVNRDHPRHFHLTMQHMEWGINGRTFEMTAAANDEIVKLDSLEVWKFVNDAALTNPDRSRVSPWLKNTAVATWEPKR